jgi:hypothetical protein
MNMMTLSQGQQLFPAAFAWMYRAASGLAVCRRNGFRDRMTNVI